MTEATQERQESDARPGKAAAPGIRDRCAPLLSPRSIAVVGASDRPGPGNRVVSNLVAGGFQGDLYLINPNHRLVGNVPTYPSVSGLPETPEMVIAAVNREVAVDVVGAAARMGSPACVLLGAGFGESDARGKELEATVRVTAADMAVMGPNCLGYVNLEEGVAAYSGPLMEPFECGNVALISNSGALACTLTGLGAERGIRFSYVITTGNGINLTIADYIRHVSTRAVVDVVACYIEGFGDGRRLLDAFDVARANGKHSVLLKAGRSRAGGEAAKTHTGSLAGSDTIQQSLWKHHDVLVAEDLEEFTALIQIASRCSTPRNARLGMITISGGERLLLADAAEQLGLPLARLGAETCRRLSELLPFYASPSNPLDTTGAGLVERDATVHGAASRVLASDPDVDIVVVSHDAKNGWVQADRRSDLFYDGVVASYEAVSGMGKPLLFLSPTAGEVDERARSYLLERRAPLLLGLQPGLTALARFIGSPTGDGDGLRQTHRAIIETTRATSGIGAMARLSRAGVEVWPTVAVETEEGAVSAAERLGYPVALKLDGAGLMHRTEVGGVRLGLGDAPAVRDGFRGLATAKGEGVVGLSMLVQPMAGAGVELFVGGIRDEQFGPVVLVGSGGVLVELIGDLNAGLAPLDLDRAVELLKGTKSFRLLNGWRGAPPVDVAALSRTLVAISEVIAQPDVQALDINPLIVWPQGIALIDAKLVLVTSGD